MLALITFIMFRYELMSKILFFFFLSFSTAISSQVSFMATYGGSDTEYPYDIVPRAGGGYLISAFTASPELKVGFPDYQDNYIIHVDDTGNVVTSFSIGGDFVESFTQLFPLDDGGFVAAGHTLSYGVGEYEMQLMRFNETNELVWAKRLGGSGYDQAYGLTQASDGGFVVAGLYTAPGDYASKAYAIKTDNDGNYEWSFYYGGAFGATALSIEPTNDNGFIMAGYSSDKKQNKLCISC